MFPRSPSIVARYIFTLVAVTLATFLRFALEPVLHLEVPFILYYPTIVLCAWFGGLWPGLLSTALGGIIAWYAFFPPQYSFTVSEPTAPTQVVIFLLAGTLISLLAESLHRARRKTEESEAKGREQRERFRVTLGSIGDAVIATDTEGQVTFMNQVAESLTGWNHDVASGRPLEEVFHIINEQTRGAVENPALRAMKEGTIVGLANHTLLVAKGGGETPIDDSGAPIKDAEGKVLGAVLIFRNITERRKAEQVRALLAGIVESSEDAIISKSLDGVIGSWNAGAERLFEYSADEAVGQPITIIIPPDRVEEERMILERLRRGERIEHFETVRVSKSGRAVDISLTVSPVRDAAGRVVGASKIARDISERKRTEEALQQQREWLRVTLSSIGDAVIATDTNGAVAFMNPVAESLTGWKQEEAEGRPLQEVFNIVNEWTRQQVENPALRAIKEGVIVGLANHTVLIAKDGAEIPIDDSGAPIKDAAGKVLGAVLIFRDITERKLAEEALRAKEAELEVIINQTPFMLTRCGSDLRYRFVSRAYAKLVGRLPEEIAGKPIVEIMGEEGFRTILPHIEKVLAGNRVEYESEVHFQGVGLRSLQVVYTPEADEAEGVKGWIASILDVTERKRAEQSLRESEERYRATFANASVGIAHVGLDGRWLHFNDAVCAITGYPREELSAKTFADITHPDDIEADWVLARRVAAGEIPAYSMVKRYLRKDGSMVWVNLMVSLLRDTKGNVQNFISIIEDITEGKRAEEERARLLASERAAREQAEAANRSKDEFVAMISHEIRSPLNAILGWAQLLRTGKFGPEETARAVETIERNARAQVQLIEDLLDISRIITGKLTLNVRPVEPAQIIQATLDSIRPAAEAKAIQLDLHLGPEGSLITADPARLQQIVWNLLSNAVKFTPKNGRVEVRVKHLGSHLQFTVSDSGVGISPEFLPFVFDRFSQANTSSERKYGGLGLGLAIVRHLVELHGGTVRADSPGEGRGATFTVELPVRAVREEKSEPERNAPSAGHVDSLTDAIAFDGLRIMIVDDEAESRDLLMTMLTQRGAEVKACTSAAEVLQAVEQWRPDVLISDIGMPDEDGYTLIRKLRALPAERGGNIPAVALTGYTRSEDRMRALAAGFQMHVPKPVEAVELIMVIASLARRLGKDLTG